MDTGRVSFFWLTFCEKVKIDNNNLILWNQIIGFITKQISMMYLLLPTDR